MYLYNLESKNYFKMIKNNSDVVIGIYENNCIISDLFKGILNKINDLTGRDIIVCIIEKSEFFKLSIKEDNNILPLILVYKNGEIIKKILGLSNYNKIIDEICC